MKITARPPESTELTESEPLTRRRRRYHNRSREGTKCLVLGRNCQYAGCTVASSNTQGVLISTFSSTNDHFGVLPVKMILASSRALHHYMYYQELVQATVPASPHAQISGLPSAMQDPVGFRTALVLSIARLRFLEGPSAELEQTSLIHKVAVMDSINQHITQFSTDTSGFVILVIAGLFEIEFAAGALDAAEAHLQGMFTLTEMSEYNQEKQLDVRMVLLYVSISSIFYISSYFCLLWKARACETVSEDVDVDTRAPTREDYALATFFYTHLVHDFLVVPNRSTLTRVSGVDTRLLRWLLASLRDVDNTAASDTRHSNHWVWQTAVGAYALTVGSLWPQDEENLVAPAQGIVEDQHQLYPITKGNSNKSKEGLLVREHSRQADNSRPYSTPFTQPRYRPRSSTDQYTPDSDELLKLRTWADEMISDWRECRRMVHWKNAGVVLQKIEWLRTTDGLKALEQICLESEGKRVL
ncbi:hypothetical protein VTL71DRAFT_1390 [Oculimacula yallundae]|uniref:Uncharacterized protein n=1 Tax=Oculimacula yallundae TaxID=86028 RepID=A0ABR4CBX6_9HELO